MLLLPAEVAVYIGPPKSIGSWRSRGCLEKKHILILEHVTASQQKKRQ